MLVPTFAMTITTVPVQVPTSYNFNGACLFAKFQHNFTRGRGNAINVARVLWNSLHVCCILCETQLIAEKTTSSPEQYFCSVDGDCISTIKHL